MIRIKSIEKRMRDSARRQGMILAKSPRRDPRAIDYCRTLSEMRSRGAHWSPATYGGTNTC